MSKMIRTLLIGMPLIFSFGANADFFSGDDCPPWVYDCNDWPEWTPMYWMEEMSNEFDDDDDYYRYGGYGAPMPYGPPPMPYGAPMPYGGPAPMPQGGPMPYGAPMPYGQAPMMAPQGRPMPPFGRPMPPYGAPAPAPVEK